MGVGQALVGVAAVACTMVVILGLGRRDNKLLICRIKKRFNMLYSYQVRLYQDGIYHSKKI